MEDKDYYNIVEFVKIYFTNKQEEYFKKEYYDRPVGFKNNVSEADHVNNLRDNFRIKFRICNKQCLEEEFEGVLEGKDCCGSFNYKTMLIWVDSDSQWEEEIVSSLIHECCHMIDYYNDILKYISKKEDEKESVAFSDTTSFIRDKIKNEFKDLYRDIEEEHEGKILRISKGHPKNNHTIACRRILRK